MNCFQLSDVALSGQIGGKGRIWWRMNTLGILVPDGFVVPSGYEPDEDELALAIELLVQRSGCSRLAVRSSGSAEDGITHSCAGLFESVLEVPADVPSLSQALSRCRRSARDSRVQAALGHSEHLAVLIQEMVYPQFSGLMFTRDPRSGRNMPFLEIVEGHLGTLVDGGEPEIRVQLNDDGRRQAADRLGNAQLDMLLEAGGRIEEMLDGPADIEWALTARGLVVLQARPMTALSRAPGIPGIQLFPVTHANLDQMPRAVRQHDKVTLRILADSLDIPIARGLLALASHPLEEHLVKTADSLCTWGEFIAVLLEPFSWQGRILRTFGTGATALEALRVFTRELEGTFVFLLKELQPTARTGIAVKLADGHVRAEVIQGHFASKGIEDATSYLLSPSGELLSCRFGQQKMMVTLEKGLVRSIPAPSPGTLSFLELSHLRDVLHKLSSHHPEAGIEFGYGPAGEFFLVDLYQGASVAPTTSGHEVLCAGRVMGRVRFLDLDGDAVGGSIERHIHNQRRGSGSASAEAEILVVARPYHLLDRLVYSSAAGTLGILCEGGSLLCHLAVVMREKGVPGLILRNVRQQVQDGDLAILDTRAGSTVLLRKLEQA